MKYHTTRAGITSCFAAACALALATPSLALKLWQDDDPASGTTVVTGGIVVTNVNSGPAIDGDHPTAGEVDLGAVTGGFVNINGGSMPITPAEYGQNFEFTVDYFVPAGTVMSATDTMYVTVKFNSVANGTNAPTNFATAGFFDPTVVAGTGWQTITITGTVPADHLYDGTGNPVDEASILIIFRDGTGGAGDPEPDAGVSLYLDDICFDVDSAAVSQKFWEDNDPASGQTVVGGGIVVNNVSTGPAIDGDHPTAGEVDLGGVTGGFTNINGGSIPITPDEHGLPFSFTVDYFVPAGTVMSATDTMYLSVAFNSVSGGTNGANFATAGFFDPTVVAGTGWQTLTITGTVPADHLYDGTGNPVDEMVAQIVFRDGTGGAGDPEPDAGVSLYLDDICLLISTTNPTFLVKLWQDDDVPSGQTVVGGGIIATNVSTGPAIDADHPTAGEIDLGSVTGGFVNMNGGSIPISSFNHGKPFTFEVDYFVPAGTVMSATDTMYVTLKFNSVASGTNAPTNFAVGGFFDPTVVAGTGWQTITLTGTVPADHLYDGTGNPVDEASILIIFRDGTGGAGDPEPDAGVSLYLDDICFEVGSSVQPTEYRKLWQDDDPASGQTVVGGGIVVNNVSTGPAIDADHPTAGEVDLGAVTGGFVNINGGSMPIVQGDYGQPFSFTVDYFVPAGTVMSATDTMYVTLKFNSVANGTNAPTNFAVAGFFDPTVVAGTGWQTITLTGNVPSDHLYNGTGNPVDEASILIIFRDGTGGAGDPEPDAGVSLYLDNICFEIGTPPVVPPVTPTVLVQINSISYDASNVGSEVMINYDTAFDDPGFEGVDVYYSSDLQSWTADGFETAVGSGLTLTRPSAAGARSYILVKPGYTGPPIGP